MRYRKELIKKDKDGKRYHPPTIIKNIPMIKLILKITYSKTK